MIFRNGGPAAEGRAASGRGNRSSCGRGSGTPELVGPTWQWEEYLDVAAGTGNITVSDPAKYTVTFLANGTAEMQADCNRAAGTYKVNGGVDLGRRRTGHPGRMRARLVERTVPGWPHDRGHVYVRRGEIGDRPEGGRRQDGVQRRQIAERPAGKRQKETRRAANRRPTHAHVSAVPEGISALGHFVFRSPALEEGAVSALRRMGQQPGLAVDLRLARRGSRQI